jgi:signal transduction histidine kinase
MGDIQQSLLTRTVRIRQDSARGVSPSGWDQSLVPDCSYPWAIRMTRVGSAASLASPDRDARTLVGAGEYRGRFAHILTGAAVGVFCLILFLSLDSLGSELQANWGQLIYWSVLILVVNFLYVDLEPIQFTLDLPLLVAVGLLFPPPISALVAFIGAADVREFRGRIGFSRAVYNRSQIGLSVFLASATFHAVASSLAHWQAALLGTALATAVFTVLNGLFVSAYYVSSRGEGRFRQTLQRLYVGRPLEFVVTYFAYGILAYALSRLYLEAGPWSVPLFLVPIVVAHVAFVRAERLAVLAENLKRRERMLERLMDRIVDERKDERLRIASGLHDDVLQSLIRISQLGYFIKREMRQGSQSATDAEELEHLSEETMQVLREVVGDLRESPVGREGLVRSLQSLVEDLRLETSVEIVFAADHNLKVPEDRQLLVYQVAKEALMNALAHAEPKSIRVEIGQGHLDWIVSIRDDGKGFDPTSVDESSHFGLGLMRERLRLLGGDLLVRSEPGNTWVEARLPTGA